MATSSITITDSHWPDSAGVEPIAIIGAACRFSGNASTQDGLWQLLSKGMTSWASNARGRFKLESFWHPHAQLCGSTNSRGLHLLHQDPAVFDNDFFGVSGVEAKAIDPQQRLMLEVAYETFENAGIPMDRLEGSNTGVYCAVPYQDYDQIQGRDPEVSPMYRFTGTGPSLVANRVSYIFDLHGPSMSVDTACSSTLVALHEACRALRAGDAEQILVGGSNLILDPDKLTVISSMQFLSPHGRCYAFDSRASGYGRGEGVAAVLLKPLRSAIRDGDAIRAVVRGSAIRSDGKTPGITMPSPAFQYDTIRRAYESAGLDPRDTAYVEAHGTGTNAGDSCEVTAFTQAFCNSRTDKLFVGTVKANLGHTECVSGLAGLVKVLLMLEKGAIVPSPTFVSANPSLELERRLIQVPTKFEKWPDGVVRRASINSSGYGGTNAHVIVEAWPEEDSRETKVNGVTVNDSASAADGIDECGNAKPRIFVWTHQRDDGLVQLASTWKRFITASQNNDERMSLDDLAFTLSSRRSRFAHRAATVASNFQELLAGIGEIEIGSCRPVKASLNMKLCYIFTGQGAQWSRMGLELLSSYPVFAQSMQRAETDLLELGATWHLLEELKKDKDASRINDAELAQPCCTAVQIALVDVLRSWNVHPNLVCGHSSGEIAAAYAAGALTAKDAIKVAYARGKAVHSLTEREPKVKGEMLAVGLSEASVREYLSNHEGSVTVACINSPRSVTLSGDVAAIDELTATFEAKEIFNRKLAVNVAYHSHHMAIVEEDYRSNLGVLEPREINPQVRMVSSVTCQDIRGQELDAAYWIRNLLCPVRFSDALSATLLPAAQPVTMIEIGPHSALRGPAMQVVQSLTTPHPVSYASCLKRNEDAMKTSLALAGELFTGGVAIDLNCVNNPDNTRRKVLTNLPSYNWNHSKAHWNESRRSEVYRSRKFPRHELLGNAAADSISAEPSWRIYIRPSEMPWIKGHCVDGQIVFSAAGFITMIVEALKRQQVASNRAWKRKVVQFKQVAIDRPLLIQDDGFGAELFTLLRPHSSSSRQPGSKWQEFRIYSVSQGNESTEHCRGLVALSDNKQSLDVKPQQSDNHAGEDSDANRWTQLQTKRLYGYLRAIGNDYSGHFASLQKVSARPWESKCDLEVQDVKLIMPSGHQQPHCLHPTTLEGCFQACLPGLKLADSLNGAQVIAAIDELYISTDVDLKTRERLSIATKTIPHGLRQHSSDISAAITGKPDQVIIRVKGMKLSSLGNGGSPTCPPEPLCHRVEWLIDPFSSSRESVKSYCKRNLVNRNQQLRRSCDPFCRSLIQHTLAQLNPEDEAAITDHLQLFLQWMRSQDVSDAEPLSPILEEKTNAVGAPGEMLVQLGQHIPGILRGDMKSLSLLLDNDLLYRLYFEDDCLNRCHAQLAEYLKLVQFKVPNLRILEIGGGTGSLTFTLLEALYGDKRGHEAAGGAYVFTDVSTSFISKLQEKAKKFESFMEFKRLDIEQPLAQQGFELGSFDVIVASNVVHATRSIGVTLRNLKTLLKPGGQIAIAELTEPSLRWGILGGGLPGWWLGASEGRLSSPLLRISQWDDNLTKNGFSGVSLEMRDYDSDEEHEVSLIISHALDTEPESEPESEPQSPAEELIIVTRNSNNDVAAEIRNGILAKLPGMQITESPLAGATRTHGTYIFLLDITENIFLTPSHDDWAQVREIVCDAKAVLWVTKGAALASTDPGCALVTGLGRSLRCENPNLAFFTLDLDPGCHSISQDSAGIVQAYERFLGRGATPHSSSEWEMAIRDGAIVVPRLLENTVVNDWIQDGFSKYHPREESDIDPSRSLGLRIRSVGMLDSLYWADDPSHSQAPKPTQIRVRLETVSLNLKDMMTVMGQLEGSSALLLEGSGTVVEVGDASQSSFSVGDKVCLFGPDGLATLSNIDARHACVVPEGMSMETAAVIPLAYSTALFALRDVARLRQGDSILIHSGAGAVGQATIAIARSFGVESIFVTAGSEERRAFVRDKFGIPAQRVLSSRDLDFGERIRELTEGRGVDVVLNSLAGDDGLAASCSAVASFGKIIEIGEKNVHSNARLEMKYLEKNVTFSVVDMALVAKERPELLRELIQTSVKMVQDQSLDVVGPITATHASEIEKQLRTMHAGNHVGKLVLNLDSSMPLKVQPQKPKLAALRKDGSYLVVGGTGCLDLTIMKYLTKLGAQRIITFSNSGQGAGMEEFFAFFEEVRRLGVDVVVLQGSVYDLSSRNQLKDMSREMPIRGVILGSAVLQDTDIKSMPRPRWCEGVGSTTMGTLDLYADLRGDLDFFILLGSTAAGVGSPGQGDYCARNAFRHAFARHQASFGFPVRAIDVGTVHDEDATTKNGGARESKPSPQSDGRPYQHSTGELLAVLNYAIQNPVAENPSQASIICGSARQDSTSNNAQDAPRGERRPDARFSHIRSRAAPQLAMDSPDDNDLFDAPSALQACSAAAAAVEATYTGLKHKLARLLAISAREVQPERSVASYGVDSLISVELRNWISGCLGAHVQMLELMSSLSMVQLAEVIARRSRLVPVGVFTGGGGGADQK